jgi:hypothetical protein
MFLTTKSRLVVGSYPYGTWSFCLGSRGCSAKLATHIHLVPRSRMCGALPPLSPILCGVVFKYRGNYTFLDTVFSY